MSAALLHAIKPSDPYIRAGCSMTLPHRCRLHALCSQRRRPASRPSPEACVCSYTGAGLFYKMQVSHGHLTAGYGASNHSFPLVFGETGSFLTSVRIQCMPLTAPPHISRAADEGRAGKLGVKAMPCCTKPFSRPCSEGCPSKKLWLVSPSFECCATCTAGHRPCHAD